MTNQTFYKYRSLSNLRWFLDIIVNQRLYMAHYSDMNDPMEGAFMYDKKASSMIGALRSGKQDMLICSLSKNYRNTLLWSHYADSHKGVCIELKINSHSVEIHDIKYKDKLTFVEDGKSELISVLTTKSSYWKYEEEIRAFKRESKNYKGHKTTRPYLKVTIKRIYLGCNMTAKDVRFYSKLIHSILGKDFPVTRMTRNDIDSGYSF